MCVCAWVILLALWMGIVKGTSAETGNKETRERNRKKSDNENGMKWAALSTAPVDDNWEWGKHNTVLFVLPHRSSFNEKGKLTGGGRFCHLQALWAPLWGPGWTHSAELLCIRSLHRSLCPDSLLPCLLAESLCLSTSSPPYSDCLFPQRVSWHFQHLDSTAAEFLHWPSLPPALSVGESYFKDLQGNFPGGPVGKNARDMRVESLVGELRPFATTREAHPLQGRPRAGKKIKEKETCRKGRGRKEAQKTGGKCQSVPPMLSIFETLSSC